MAEITHPTTLTEAQLTGTACRTCGSDERPLHPDESLTIREAVGVVRDLAVCTHCLVIGQ